MKNVYWPPRSGKFKCTRCAKIWSAVYIDCGKCGGPLKEVK